MKMIFRKLSWAALIFSFVFAYTALAQSDYVPLTNELPPQLQEGGSATIDSFLPGLVTLGIAVAGALSVIFIIVGGIQYLSTDAWSGKEEGKEKIKDALLGLMLAIGAYAILYTIDKDLVTTKISIKPVGTTTPISIDGGVLTSGTTRRTAEQMGCNDCIPIPPDSFPVKSYNLCSNEPCYVNSALAGKLEALADDLSSQNIRWRVTEAFPPTVTHIDPCHQERTVQSGQCVDASLESPTNENILKLFTAVEKIFGPNASFAYERCDSNRKNPLLNNPQFQNFREHLQCYGTTNAQHIHINLR